MTVDLGLVVGSIVRPERLAEAAGLAETAGFDELWIAEELFITGGISAANIALAGSERLRVGLGVVSAMVRHPALLGMEIATTARAYPGRFLPGIGLGVPDWMRKMNLFPQSPLTAVKVSAAINTRGSRLSRCSFLMAHLRPETRRVSEGLHNFGDLRVELLRCMRVPLDMNNWPQQGSSK